MKTTKTQNKSVHKNQAVVNSPVVWLFAFKSRYEYIQRTNNCTYKRINLRDNLIKYLN